jgi:hypothetical protein
MLVRITPSQGQSSDKTVAPPLIEAIKLEHDPEKWKPVFRKRSCSNNEMRFLSSAGARV